MSLTALVWRPESLRAVHSVFAVPETLLYLESVGASFRDFIWAYTKNTNTHISHDNMGAQTA